MKEGGVVVGKGESKKSEKRKDSRDVCVRE